MKTVSRPRCPSCEGTGDVSHEAAEDHYFGVPGRWTVRRCARCATLWLDPAPDPQALGEAYASYHTHEGRARAGLAQRLRGLASRLSLLSLKLRPEHAQLQRQRRERRLMFLDDLPAGRLLDVGCGGGRFLRRMQRRGWTVEGVDFDPEATARVTRRYGITAHTGDVRELVLPRGAYDAVVMNHAIEHLPDPVAALRACAGLLRPGGRLVLVTPNASSVARRRFGVHWRGLEVPRHLQVFSRAGLAECVRRAGLEVAEARTFSCDAAPIYRVSADMRRSKLGRPQSAARAERAAMLATLAEHRRLAAAPDCGEDVLVVALRN